MRNVRKVELAETPGIEYSFRGSIIRTLTLWSMLVACTAGCTTFSLPTNDPQEIRQQTPSESPVFLPSDATVTQPLTGTETGNPIILPRRGTSDLQGRREPTWSPMVRENDLTLRAPLRQTWAPHPRLVPLGSDVELERPDSEIFAHRDHVTSGPFRNPYAGSRDQPLFYRDNSTALASNSTLSGVGPPPPHHTVKTFGTLTAISFIGIGVYAFAPESFTGVSKAGALKEAKQDFKDAWTKPPVFDKDNGMYNYAGHPYVGMNFYLSQRNYGESPLYSFLFSALSSTCFEYFVESWAERPSVQDLLITPIVGSILGELVFRATQEMRKDGFTKTEKVILTIINPLYVMQNGYR